MFIPKFIIICDYIQFRKLSLFFKLEISENNRFMKLTEMFFQNSQAEKQSFYFINLSVSVYYCPSPVTLQFISKHFINVIKLILVI